MSNNNKNQNKLSQQQKKVKKQRRRQQTAVGRTQIANVQALLSALSVLGAPPPPQKRHGRDQRKQQKYQKKQQREPRRPQQQKPKVQNSPSNNVKRDGAKFDSQQNLDLSAIFGLGVASQPFSAFIHPQNPQLFEAVAQFSNNFQMWQLTHLELVCTPLASNFSSGAYCITFVSSEDANDQFQPTWANLLNVGTTKVVSISQSCNYVFRRDILARMPVWLMRGEQTSVTTPGRFYIALSPDASSGSNGIPPMPVVRCYYKFNFKAFRPLPAKGGADGVDVMYQAKSSVAPFTVFNFFLSVAYQTDLLHVFAMTPAIWGQGFKQTAQLSGLHRGPVLLLLTGKGVISGTTVQYKDKALQPVHTYPGVDFDQKLYDFHFDGSGSMTFLVVKSTYIQSLWTTAFYGITKLPVIPAAYLAARLGRVTGQVVRLPPPEPSVRSAEDPGEESPSERSEMNEGPIGLAFIPPKPFEPDFEVGFTWMLPLVAREMTSDGTWIYILNQQTQLLTKIPNSAVVGPDALINFYTALGTIDSVAKQYMLLSVVDGQAYLQKRKVPKEVGVPEFVAKLQSFKYIV